MGAIRSYRSSYSLLMIIKMIIILKQTDNINNDNKLNECILFSATKCHSIDIV